MKTLKLGFLSSFILLFVACHKDSAITTNSSATQTDLLANKGEPSADPCTSMWKGSYISLNGTTDVSPKAHILNGILKLDNSPYSYYWEELTLAVPKEQSISGDSLKFEVSWKNPVSEGAIEELDAYLVAYGSRDQDTAKEVFIGRSYRQQFTALEVNSLGVTNSPKLVQLFNNWTTVSMVTEDHHISAYRNDTLLTNSSYRGARVGNLSKILIGFKGVGSIDWVKLYNSNTGALLMEDDFTTDHDGTVNWCGVSSK